MNLYEVTNGWIGESYVRVYVIAATEARALELARGSYQAARPNDPRNWERLSTELLCVMDGKELVTVPSDDGWELKSDE